MSDMFDFDDDFNIDIDDLPDDLTIEDIDEPQIDDDLVVEESKGKLAVGDFDFSEFYDDEGDSSDDVEQENEEVSGVLASDSAYDELLDLNGSETSLKVEARYPYLRISGFLISDEINVMKNNLEELNKRFSNVYDSEEMIDVCMNVNGDDYKVTQVPLNLEVMIKVKSAHNYDVEIVKGNDASMPITSYLMKSFIFM